MIPYALTIFTGAFLLFQVQPLIGKYILPWYGGGPGVWTTCMVFFQLVLLGGYAYAHLITKLLRPRAQALLHLALVLGSLLLQPIIPSDAWKPTGAEDPVGSILRLLTASLGLPYFVVSSTGPLMQQWFSRTRPGVSPYRLYALSNVGSLLALLSYPFFFEPWFTRQQQAELWGWGLAAYAVFCSGCAWMLWRRAEVAPMEVAQQGQPEDHPPSRMTRWLWLLLPACASVLLVATTNKMCQDVAVIPFLWVLPLALYLVSFIVAFESPRWYVRMPYAAALVAALTGVTRVLFEGVDASLGLQVGVYSAGLFVCCLVCHGELYRLRPHPSRLTSFYLTISAGGALGGLFVGLVAPQVFADYLEVHWGLWLCAVLFTVVCIRDRRLPEGRSEKWLAIVLTVAGLAGLDRLLNWLNRQFFTAEGARYLSSQAFWVLRLAAIGIALVLFVAAWGRLRTFRNWRRVVLAWLGLGSVALGIVLMRQTRIEGRTVYQGRSFYGTLKVLESVKRTPEFHSFELRHGRIVHGMQFVDPESSKLPAGYYGQESGLGMALDAATNHSRHVGIVGLGTGTIAAHGRAGDRFRFYEINPEVVSVARSHFSYLSNSEAKVEVVLGDARLSLEKEAPQGFDLLALDAFSSDAIPVHLLTREAFALYARHLKPGGVVAVHISNRYLDLEPAIRTLAGQLGWRMATVDFGEEEKAGDSMESAWFYYSSVWILLSNDPRSLESPKILQAMKKPRPQQPEVPLWTDDFASLFQVLR